MKKKKKVEHLRIRRETIVNLKPKDLPAIAGGGLPTGPSYCNLCQW